MTRAWILTLEQQRQYMQSTIDKIDKVVHLSEERNRQLIQMASAGGTTEDALIEKALDILFELSRAAGKTERQNWSVLSAEALNRVWDNDADAVYDNWKELYGVQQG